MPHQYSNKRYKAYRVFSAHSVQADAANTSLIPIGFFIFGRRLYAWIALQGWQLFKTIKQTQSCPPALLFLSVKNA